jgi:hypothetical protein
VDSELIGALPVEPGGMFSAILTASGEGLLYERGGCWWRLQGEILGVVASVRCVVFWPDLWTLLSTLLRWHIHPEARYQSSSSLLLDAYRKDPLIRLSVFPDPDLSIRQIR